MIWWTSWRASRPDSPRDSVPPTVRPDRGISYLMGGQGVTSNAERAGRSRDGMTEATYLSPDLAHHGPLPCAIVGPWGGLVEPHPYSRSQRWVPGWSLHRSRRPQPAPTRPSCERCHRCPLPAPVPTPSPRSQRTRFSPWRELSRLSSATTSSVWDSAGTGCWW